MDRKPNYGIRIGAKSFIEYVRKENQMTTTANLKELVRRNAMIKFYADKDGVRIVCSGAGVEVEDVVLGDETRPSSEVIHGVVWRFLNAPERPPNRCFSETAKNTISS